MIEIQLFKQNDDRDQKVKAAVEPIFSEIDSSRDDFYDGAWTASPLGDVLYQLSRDPTAGVVTQDTFRQAFPAIHEIFSRPGTFEFYLEVFRAIWGQDVEVEFEVPDPGELLINIEALTAQQDDWIARSIVDNKYVFDEIVDHEGDNIAFQTRQGIKTQKEVDALILEIYPAGVWVQTTLVIG